MYIKLCWQYRREEGGNLVVDRLDGSGNILDTFSVKGDERLWGQLLALLWTRYNLETTDIARVSSGELYERLCEFLSVYGRGE